MRYYSNPKRESDPHSLPDIEVFHEDILNDEDQVCETGWYWWPCLPGCLPDSEPHGPFATELEALTDARNIVADDYLEDEEN